MKRHLVLFTFLILVICPRLQSEEMNATDEKIKTLLKQVEAVLAERGYDYPNAVIDSGNKSLRKIPAYVELQSLIISTWPQAMSGLQVAVTSETTEAILLVAFESSLDADKYFQCVEQFVGLAEKNKFSKVMLRWALLPAEKNMRGVFVYNNNKPVVIGIMQRVKSMYPQDESIVKFCNSILSGDAKREAESYYDDNPMESRPKPAH